MAKVRLTQAVMHWVARSKSYGQEIRATRNGHPYAVIRAGTGPKATKKK